MNERQLDKNAARRLAIIRQLAAVAAQIAAAHEEPAPASIAAAPTTRVKALDLLFRGSTVPASYDAPSYPLVMTGPFASYHVVPRGSQIKLPIRARRLIVVIDATTLMATDATMHDEDDTGLLAQLGPVGPDRWLISAVAARARPFGYDWMGRQFAMDSARAEGREPLVLLLEPGTGEVLEIPFSFARFHEQLDGLCEPAFAGSFLRQLDAS